MSEPETASSLLATDEQETETEVESANEPKKKVMEAETETDASASTSGQNAVLNPRSQSVANPENVDVIFSHPMR